MSTRVRAIRLRYALPREERAKRAAAARAAVAASGCHPQRHGERCLFTSPFADNAAPAFAKSYCHDALPPWQSSTAVVAARPHTCQPLIRCSLVFSTAPPCHPPNKTCYAEQNAMRIQRRCQSAVQCSTMFIISLPCPAEACVT